MPNRPNQHQIEDISRAKFKLALPREWLLRDKDKDYGVDCEVEIFDNNNKTTGLVFLVQLKATESVEENIIMNVDMEIDTLLYYKQLSLPVLLVRYSTLKDAFYVKWINNVDLFFAKKEAKTFRLKLNEENKWGSSTAELIKIHLIKLKKLRQGSFGFPVPISFEILENKINTLSKNIILPQVRKCLKEHSDFIKIEDSKKDSLIEITLDNEQLFINACDFVGCTYHSIETRPQTGFAIEVGKDILLGIAIVMLHVGQVEYCGRIIFECKLEKKLVEKEELLLFVLPSLLKSSYFEKVLNLIGPILDNPNFYKIDLLTKVSVVLNSNIKNTDKINAIENFLVGRLNSAINIGDKSTIGISNYNLGNHYRSRGIEDQSVKHYLEAKRNEPFYLKQHYFFSELAGVFFGMNRFGVSSKLYLKSLELGSSPRHKALCADALMFNGQHRKAKELFDEYLTEIDKPVSEFVLKSFCLGKLLVDGYPEQQVRDPMGAIQLADILRLNEGDNKLEKFERALDLDLFCALAWFNLGICYNEKSENSRAAFSFTMAGLILTIDIEAWVNATLCSISQNETTSMFPLIIRTAYYFNREDYLENLYGKLNNSELPEVDKLIEVIELIVKEDRETENKPVVRVLNKHGIFENVFEKKG